MTQNQMPEGPFDDVQIDQHEDGTFHVIAHKGDVRVDEHPIESKERAEEIAQLYREGQRGVEVDGKHVVIGRR